MFRHCILLLMQELSNTAGRHVKMGAKPSMRRSTSWTNVMHGIAEQPVELKQAKHAWRLTSPKSCSCHIYAFLCTQDLTLHTRPTSA